MHVRQEYVLRTLTVCADVTSRFWLLRSRCIIGGSRECRYSSPLAQSVTIRSTSSISIGDPARGAADAISGSQCGHTHPASGVGRYAVLRA